MVNQVDIEENPPHHNSKFNNWYQRHKVLVLVLGVGAGVLIAIGIILAIVFSTIDKKDSTTTSTTRTTPISSSLSTTTLKPIEPRLRVDCLPWLKLDNNTDNLIKECAKYDYCSYNSVDNNKQVPSCYYENDKMAYQLLNTETTDLGVVYTIQRRNSQKQYKNLKIYFEFLDNYALRFKIVSPDVKEYEVPIKINKPNIKAKEPKYDVVIDQTGNSFNFRIIRKSTGTVIWDTSLGPLVFEELHKQISTRLPSENVYGFGENRHESFKHDLNYKNWPIWGRDEAPENEVQGNLYSNQPFYTCMEKDGKSHGVVLVNSNALDYEFSPAPGLTYRATGGILDFYVFLGPEPENVIQQFTEYFGRTFFPPYWALGFQISRYGYLNLDDMKQVLDRFGLHKIPLDTQVADIDHFDKRKDFTIDPQDWKGLPEYFDYIHSRGMKTVLLIDPALVVNETDYWPYTTGLQNNVFIKWPKNQSPDFAETGNDIMLGYCWPPAKVAYPDFMKISTQDWWIKSILRHHQTLKFDGLWIDMNEPAVFGTNDEKPFNWPVENTPYWSLKCPDDKYETVKTKASYMYGNKTKLSQKTLCMVGLQGENDEYKHYDVHNLYGYFESIPTWEAAKQLEKKDRGFVITRSTFLGGGQYSGHWTGDNHSLWRHLYYSIIGMLEFNLFGIPYVGADICGFWLNTTDELCARWSSLGAFYPFSRNHNNEFNTHQDPGALSDDVVRSARNALIVRYEILPYYYTLFYKAHTKGNTVVRPLFHEFPHDNKTYSIDKQFLVGPAFLVTPVLDEGKTSVEGYYPAGNWYNYYDGSLVVSDQDKGSLKSTYAPIDFIPLHIRGGYIMPTQDWALTTELTRKNPFGLIVAPNSDGEAQGDLFYDDGYTDVSKDKHYYATFSLRDARLKFNVEVNNYPEMENLKLNKIRLFVKPPSGQTVKFILNNKILSADHVKLNQSEIVLVNLNLKMSENFELEWVSESYVTTDASLSEPPVIDCLQGEDKCVSKGCVYNRDSVIVPKCTIPTDKSGYRLSKAGTLNSDHELVKADDFSLFGNDVQNVNVKVQHGSVGNEGKRFTRIKIYDRDHDRYEVPVKLNTKYDDQTFMNVKIENSANSKAYFEVSNQNGDILFDTKETEHGFIFSDQFIQIVMNLRDYKNLYGFGENTHFSYKHRFSYTNWWGVFGRDQPPGGKTINLYGAHPFFMGVNEKTGRAFGALILNSNAQEYGLLPSSSISYRTIGGILDFYIMEASSPESLIQAYTSLIGTPYMPPYWALGFQLSRYGYNSLDKLKAAVDRTIEAKIPYDIQYADIDHFRKQLDFTYDPVNFAGLPQYIKDLRTKGVRFIIILDPAINMEEPNYSTYQEGFRNDIYIKWPEDENPQKNETSDNKNTYMVGYVWPEGKTVFPDFFRERTKQWWMKEIDQHYKNVLTFDGLWIDMNEPANFDTNKPKPWNWPSNRPEWNLKCPNNNYDDPPYVPIIASHFGSDTRISDKTLCMRGVQGDKDEFIHYDVHNLYGWSQTEPTLNALRQTLNKRSIVITRSTYPSSGTHAGHWLGDNNSLWSHLKQNIIGLLEMNLFGIPYIGADICGFFGDATPEMCTRWMQIGAFNTFYRNHNGFNGVDQDPLALGKDVADASRRITEIRYSLLPSLYTQFYHVNKFGGTVIRSLMHEFPTDSRALDIDRQFMWGSYLLISPVLDINTRTVYAYFPKTRWFDFYSGKEVESTGRVHEIDAPLDHIPLHVRGGSILVTQEHAVNTDLSRKNPFGLIIAPLNLNKKISTYLYWDEGDIIDATGNMTMVVFEFTAGETSHVITMKAMQKDYPLLDSNKLKTIRVFGVNGTIKSITVNGVSHSKFEHDPRTYQLTINELSIKLDTDTLTEVKINL